MLMAKYLSIAMIHHAKKQTCRGLKAHATFLVQGGVRIAKIFDIENLFH
jgi:hypothetical protein